jgi:hypothetical protein
MRPKPVPKIRVRKGSAINATRAEFEAVITLLNRRGEIIDEIRRELHSTCHELAAQVEKNRRMLEIQFTRIAQIQQELDDLKTKNGR